MNRYDKFYKILIEEEGGWVNDPKDSGGETYKGVSRVYNPKWEGWRIIDEYKKTHKLVKGSIIKDASLDELIKSFYKKNYYFPLGIEAFTDELLALSLFDFGVNGGVKPAMKLLQYVLGITEDGIVGKITYREANSQPSVGQRYNEARIDAYKKKKMFYRFGDGWISRVNKLESKL